MDNLPSLNRRFTIIFPMNISLDPWMCLAAAPLGDFHQGLLPSQEGGCHLQGLASSCRGMVGEWLLGNGWWWSMMIAECVIGSGWWWLMVSDASWRSMMLNTDRCLLLNAGSSSGWFSGLLPRVAQGQAATSSSAWRKCHQGSSHPPMNA